MRIRFSTLKDDFFVSTTPVLLKGVLADFRGRRLAITLTVILLMLPLEEIIEGRRPQEKDFQ